MVISITGTSTAIFEAIFIGTDWVFDTAVEGACCNGTEIWTTGGTIAGYCLSFFSGTLTFATLLAM